MRRRADHAVAIQIRSLLAESPEIDPFTVGVVVDHHVVTLHGRVDSAAVRAVVRHVAESVPGVNFVHDQITISASSTSNSARPPTRTVAR